jgi:uncharacterized Zn finger protein
MPRRSWDDRWRAYPESRPRPAQGIATSKQRGAMAEHWWSQRFVDVLDAYGLGARMQRGRRYARAGQVLTLQVTPGLLSAQVQGSRSTPYLVTVQAPPVDDRSWAVVEAELRASVGLVARLMAGQVPPELEEIAAGAGLPLLPGKWGDLRTHCSCPDWESPCKHLAAVLYVFADQLDADPWLLLTWRGRTRADLLAHLEEISSRSADDRLPSWWPLRPAAPPEASSSVNASAVSGSPVVAPVPSRWQPPAAPPPESPAAVLARLAPLDATALGRPAADIVSDAYAHLLSDDHPTTPPPRRP